MVEREGGGNLIGAQVGICNTTSMLFHKLYVSIYNISLRLQSSLTFYHLKTLGKCS